MMKNSLKEYSQNNIAIANEACQMASQKMMYFLVEGDSDALFYQSLMNKRLVVVKPCKGKKNVLDIYKLISLRNKNQFVYAILDLDYDQLTSTKVEDSHIVYTDVHDLEIMIFKSDAFERVSMNIYSMVKLQKYGPVSNFRNIIIEMALDLGIFRLLNEKENLNLKFKASDDQSSDLNYKKFIHKGQYLGIEKMIETVKQYGNQAIKLDTNLICSQILHLKESLKDYYLLIHGHDVSHIMALFCNFMKKSGVTINSREDIEACMRMAYSIADFSQTNMYFSLAELAEKQGLSIWR